jgi:putative membrane protein
MMGWDVGFGDGWMVPGGWLMLLLFWGILATLIMILVIRAVQDAGIWPSQSPMGILKRRYDSGEIDDQEYENIRQQLQAF